MSTLPTVLLIDDDVFLRTLVKDHLGDCRVLEASDGLQALACLATERPDLIFLDLLMPHQSGVEALREIRRQAPDARLVILSSLDDPSLQEALTKEGADRFISKPPHLLELREEVERLTQASRR